MRPTRSAAILVAFVLAACSSSPITSKAASPCDEVGLGMAQTVDRNAHLVAAFASNVADVASWESTGYGNGALRVRTSLASGVPLDRVDVCYYEGAFNIGGHPMATAGATVRPWDLLLVLVDRYGVARVASAGYRETMPLASPVHGP
jgi:hypothetical protein